MTISALTIAGSDPSGGAGLQADIKTFRAFGIHDLSVPTALTVQNTQGVYDIFDIAPSMVEKQLNAILQDIIPQAVKTGMLNNHEIVGIVADGIKRYRLQNLVVDPVMKSTSGARLMESQARKAMVELLFPLAALATPNLDEAQALAEIEVKDVKDMQKAAQLIYRMGPKAVLVKGGHLSELPVDVLWDGTEFSYFKTHRVYGSFHGTGCALSSAIAASLALGLPLNSAVSQAKSFLYNALSTARPIGQGLQILNLTV
jgi:hydroxymethylpyrimidine/phosphomethylpyrimidine kinase